MLTCTITKWVNIKFKILSIHCQIRSGLSNPCCSTSSDPRYTSHLFDILTNLSANHKDTQLVLNRGLSIDNKTGNIRLRGKSDNALLESVDSKEIFQILFFYQKYAQWDRFLAYTCNQKTLFGTAPIANWLDSGAWKIILLDFIILGLLKKRNWTSYNRIFKKCCFVCLGINNYFIRRFSLQNSIESI